ncbi:MAG: type 1 glutamine amidotransferase [Actinobacteria bacterium]|nr:type 1 glutamine amidotransferase [Actinomycetota bacterium]
MLPASPARDARPLLVLHHIPEPTPNAYEQELAARGIAAERVLPARGDALPDWRDYAGIVALGGPMGAVEDARWNWLAAERRLIADAVRAGTPYWGVCLGAQLLAASLAAPVMRGPAPEVGLAEIALCADAADDPVFGAAPARFRAFALHQDTFALPDGARRLASSAQYENQAFVWGGAAYGLQFHLEPDRSLADHWLAKPKYARLLRALPGAQARRLATDVRAHTDRATRLARELFGRWLERVVFAPERG